jgi:hypothetical protein
MRRAALALTTAGLVLAVLATGTLTPPALFDSESAQHTLTHNCSHDRAAVAVCFAPGTDPAYMAEWTRRINERVPLDYNIGNRWSQTATDGFTGTQGDGVTLTYSYAPDGLFVDGQSSVLYQRMNELFGSEDLWQAQMDTVFARWQQLTGNTYVHVSDDGANWGGNVPGELGARGDVRIGMIDIDGPSGVLAYNSFPNNGDMVIDASENWGSGTQNYVFLRNVAMHEHGHGLGMFHVCPDNSTKLMEPSYSSAFNGPQHDDIRAGQRMYGDNCEPNDTAIEAFDLGQLEDGHVLRHVSLDDNGDTDFYRFSMQGGMAMTIELAPDGRAYLEGQQNGDGSCQAGTMINTIDDNNLDLTMYAADGTTMLAQSAVHPAGQSELIDRYITPAGLQTYTLAINGASANQVQLYELRFTFVDPATPWLTGCPLEFGEVDFGGTAELTATVVNPPEGGELSLTEITTTGPFEVESSGPALLEPSGTLDLTITYSADTMGDAEGLLTIVHNGPGDDLTCELTGKAVEVELTVLPDNDIDFGEVEPGVTDSARVVLRAQGNTNLYIESVALSGGPYSMSFAGPVELVPGPVYNLYPHFTPPAEGEFTGTMTIEHTGVNSPTIVNLTGTGMTLSGETAHSLPREFALAQNYPNPFNPATTIRFSLASASPANVTVYDITGREVATLINQSLPAGVHELDFQADNLPAGVYLYRLTTASFTDTKKMILLK